MYGNLLTFCFFSTLHKGAFEVEFVSIMEIRLQNLNKTYSRNENSVEACKNVSLLIPSNAIDCIIRKSGAGKSTLVRLISLLEKPDSGEIFYDDKRVDNL